MLHRSEVPSHPSLLVQAKMTKAMLFTFYWFCHLIITVNASADPVASSSKSSYIRQVTRQLVGNGNTTINSNANIATMSTKQTTQNVDLPMPNYFAIIQESDTTNYFAIAATTEHGLQQQKQQKNRNDMLSCVLETFPGTNRWSIFQCNNTLYYINTKARIRLKDGVLVYLVNATEVPVEVTSIDGRSNSTSSSVTNITTTTAPSKAPTKAPITAEMGKSPTTVQPTSVNINNTTKTDGTDTVTSHNTTNVTGTDSASFMDSPWLDKETLMMQVESMNAISILGMISFVLLILLVIGMIIYVCCCRRCHRRKETEEFAQTLSSLVVKDPNRNIPTTATNIDRRAGRTTSSEKLKGNFFGSIRSIDGNMEDGNRRNATLFQSSVFNNNAYGGDDETNTSYITNTRQVDYYRNVNAPVSAAAREASDNQRGSLSETMHTTSNHSQSTMNNEQIEYEFTEKYKLTRKNSIRVNKICENHSYSSDAHESDTFADPMFEIKFGDDEESQNNTNSEDTDGYADGCTTSGRIEEMAVSSWNEKKWKVNAKKNQLKRIL